MGLIAIVLLVVTTWFSFQDGLGHSDWVLQDFSATSKYRAPSPQVVLVAIDESSLAAIGRWPWRRVLHAGLIDRISLDRPKAIGIDIIFSEKDPASEQDDVLLAQAMQRSGAVVLPILVSKDNTNVAALPVTDLANAAAALGHINQGVDSDGVARSINTRMEAHDQHWDHFALELLRVGGDSASGGAAPHSPNEAASTEEPIAFTGGARPFSQVSYVDVIKGKVQPGFFEGKYVLVGVTAGGLGSIYSVLGQSKAHQMAGVEIIANVLDAKLQGVSLRVASRGANALFNAGFVVAALFCLAALRPFLALVALAVLAGCSVLSAYMAASWTGVLFAPAIAIVVVVLIYPIWSWRRLSATMAYLTEESSRIKNEWHLAGTSQPMLLNGDFVESRIMALEAASEQLQALHRFINNVLWALPDATIVINNRGFVLIGNDAAVGHFGLTEPEQLQGMTFDELMANTLGLDSGQPAVTFAGLAQRHEAVSFEAVHRNGRETFVRCAPYVDVDQDAGGWIVSLVDIYLLRAAERERDEAFHFISHDMRSPQSSILALLQLNKMSEQTCLDAATVSRIEMYARKTLQLAEDFIQIARVKSALFQPQLIDLGEILAEAVDEVWPQWSAKRMNVAVFRPDEPALCRGESRSIARALNNLLVNAIKYSEPGAEVTASLFLKDDRWAVTISDRGPGIPMEQQAFIFQRFRQVATDQRAFGGVGLGLEFVRLVAERHKGTVGLQSTPGNGSIFSLLIPAALDEGEDREHLLTH